MYAVHHVHTFRSFGSSSLFLFDMLDNTHFSEEVYTACSLLETDTKVKVARFLDQSKLEKEK